MDWQSVAKEELRRYRAREKSLDCIKQKLQTIELQLTSIGSGFKDRTPVSGGGSGLEDRRLSLIMEKEELRRNYIIAKRVVNDVEKGLAALTKEQRLILERFYVDNQYNKAERIAEELGYSKSRLYELRREALRVFTLNLYGVVDI